MARDNRIRITVKIRGVGQREHRFPKGTPAKDIAAWKDQQRVDLRDVRRQPIVRGSTRQDVERYLATLIHRPRLQAERRRYLTWLCDQQDFGTRPRALLRRDELATALATLALTHSASHCNHVHSAFFNLITTLDGKSAPNIMRDVPRHEEPEAEARGLPYALVRVILAKLPDRGQGLRGQKRGAVSHTKIRLRMMAYCGMTYAQMKRLEPSDMRPTGVFVKRRKKGKGVAGSLKPLNADARLALADMAREGLLGKTFSRHSVYKSFQRACRAVEKDAEKAGTPISLEGVRPYDFRHAFGSAVYEATGGNLQAVMEMLDQRSAKTARRYTLGAIPAHLAAASQAVEAFLASQTADRASRDDKNTQ